MLFIDNWKSGWGGGLISAAQWGQLGLPHTQPLPFGVLLGAPRGGMLGGAQAPMPFWRGRGSTACLQGGHPVLTLPAEARSAPSPAHPCLLTLPPGASPAGFAVSSPWRGREEPGWMNVTTENRPNQVFCCRVGKIREGERERKAGFAECLKHK